MTTLFRFPIHPRRVSLEIKAAPRWLVAAIVLAFIAIVTEYFLQPIVLEVLLHHLPQSVTLHDTVAIRQQLHEGETVRLLFLPIRLLLGWTSFALALWLASRLIVSREPFRFQHMLAMEVHAESAIILGKVASLLATMAGLPVAGSGLLVPWSLARWIPSSDLVGSTLLNSINPFSLLYIAFLSIGVSVICRVGRWKAFAIVLAVWSLSATLNVATLALLKDEFHFLV